tara:strand:- start:279 stop:1088 length:810 start_codon:yes stop_codon:yes gene_type:complete
MKYFNVRVKPNIAADGMARLINASTKADVDMSAGALVFDWTEFYIPKGASKLENVTMYMNGEDGGAAVAGDFHLLFAKDVDGVAPQSAGTIGAAGITSCFNLATNFLGGVVLEGTTAGIGKLKGPAHGSLYGLTRGGGANNGGGPIQANLLADGEETSDRPGYQRIYVCGITDNANDDLNFTTGILADGAVTSDTATTITVKTVDARKVFQVGDSVHLHDVDTALGTVKSVTDTVITLNAAIAGGTDIADEDEIINANPIKILLGFSQA